MLAETLPPEICAPLDKWREKVTTEQPLLVGEYAQNAPYSFSSEYRFDPNVPGCSKQWIYCHDKKQIWDRYSGLPMERALIRSVSRLINLGYEAQSAFLPWLMERMPSKVKLVPHRTALWYKPGDFMGWHTNSNMLGVRCYLTWAEESGKSAFRYYDHEENRVVDDYDVAGWNARIFYVMGIPAKFYWHCVWSNTNRISIGFRCAGDGPLTYGELPYPGSLGK